jgi:nucleotide-binding universal stress UspA family protein
MIKKILVPVDGSDQSKSAIALAAELARNCQASLTVLHVMTKAGTARVPPELKAYEEIEHVTVTERDLLRATANEIVEEALVLASDAGAEAVQSEIRVGDPAGTIVNFATESEADLIVMGRRGLGGVTGLLLGSVTQKVAQAARCACLTVP